MSWSHITEDELVSNLGSRERTRQGVLFEIIQNKDSGRERMNPESQGNMEEGRKGEETLPPIAARFISPTGGGNDSSSDDEDQGMADTAWRSHPRLSYRGVISPGSSGTSFANLSSRPNFPRTFLNCLNMRCFFFVEVASSSLSSSSRPATPSDRRSLTHFQPALLAFRGGLPLSSSRPATPSDGRSLTRYRPALVAFFLEFEEINDSFIVEA
ncbi:uncharacterized protein C8R40DRAFT_1174781 [Lentinula edodes]|uniref:uncharacterized protein n=1 Tax=Lentinula edodes TaxID=5353 RepID=UPI001E8DE221|nr:uncharacterized protein C8R40DRAFT_1174781 [Lentinula edodes]KAH7871347.1 hypothetical protein C8R40DRAFT_1174781 [Lentinula edodes]